MSFLKPCALYHFAMSYTCLRWMPCQSWGFLRWPGLDGFLRLLAIVLLWSMFSELRFIPSSSMYPTLRVGDRILVEKSGHRWDTAMFSDRERQEKFNKLMGVKGEAKVEQNSNNQNGNDLLRAEKQKELQLDLEKQYTAGLRRRDGRTVGLGL